MFELMCKKLDALFNNPRQAYMAMNGERSGGADIVEFVDFVRRSNLLTAQQTADGYAEALFHHCDRDRDQRINYKEWCRVMRTDDRCPPRYTTRWPVTRLLWLAGTMN